MATFRFRLEKLLQLRQTELEQLEALAAHALGLAQQAKRRHLQLLEQLNSLGDRGSQWSWNVVQAGAEGLMLATDVATQERQIREAECQELSQYVAKKRIEVEALTNLRQRQFEAHRAAEQRRADHELQEQILRQWTLDNPYRATNDAGRVNHG